jgi:hypothetical protein
MRFVAVSTIFAAVVTLAIHGVSASSVGTVKKTDQVNQGVSYLSKGKETTCAFEDGTKHTSLEEKNRLYSIMTKLHGSKIGCEFTNTLLRLSTSPEFSELPGKDSRIDKRSSSDPEPGSDVIIDDVDDDGYGHRLPRHHGPRRHRFPGQHGNRHVLPSGSSPSLILNVKYRKRISPKEEQELQDTLTLLVGKELGTVLTKSVVESKFIIKFFKALEKSKNNRKLLAMVFSMFFVSGCPVREKPRFGTFTKAY